jgi:hypothetical protein
VFRNFKTSQIIKNTPNSPNIITFSPRCGVVVKLEFERLSGVGVWPVNSSPGEPFYRSALPIAVLQW